VALHERILNRCPRAGVCDDDVQAQAEMFADLADLIAGEMEGFRDEDLAF
jgi:hypothetical protein